MSALRHRYTKVGNFSCLKRSVYVSVRNSGTLDSIDGIKVSLQRWQPYAASIFKVWHNHGFI